MLKWSTENFYKSFRHTEQLAYPSDVFSLVGSKDKLVLSIKERYVLEIIARLLDRYNYDATIYNLDYCPFNFLEIGGNTIFAKLDKESYK